MTTTKMKLIEAATKWSDKKGQKLNDIIITKRIWINGRRLSIKEQKEFFSYLL